MAFKIHPADNVATVLEKASDRIRVFGAEDFEIELREAIPASHKVALRFIAADEAVVKFGVRIGYAMTDIEVGEWVHLSNLSSDFDQRSGTFDAANGVPSDTRYE